MIAVASRPVRLGLPCHVLKRNARSTFVAIVLRQLPIGRFPANFDGVMAQTPQRDSGKAWDLAGSSESH